MKKQYTDERNTQILISLMKAHGVRKIVASPGTTNICLVGSLQQDPFFELYSSVDERSAAYIACGMATESGEPVALSCTGATASRNYPPGLTEAFYRKLPILAITSTQHTGRIGQHMPQVIDRTTVFNDIAKLSVQIPIVHGEEDEWASTIALNKALLELKRNGGGPVHVNLTTTYSRNFNVAELPETRVINRICSGDALPELHPGRVGVFVGAHVAWTTQAVEAVEAFCSTYDAVVFCDHTSNYTGEHRVMPSLVCSQMQYKALARKMNVLIHIGEISGADMEMIPNQVWRVNPDGEIRDTFRKLRYVFAMNEQDFFSTYASKPNISLPTTNYLQEWKTEISKIVKKIPELPFSNAWIARESESRLPEDCVLHIGILNSLRTWNFFETPPSVLGYANTGGFGIDGAISTLLGASLASPEKLHIAVMGDLAFFYDMNALGNRHFGQNVRIILVNNGRGTEFRNYLHPAEEFGVQADDYMAAAGHFGRKSPDLVKHYAEDLGFDYMAAYNKQEYLQNFDRFISKELSAKSIIFEVFTDSKDESAALRIMYELETSTIGAAKGVVRNVFGEKGVQALKKIIKR